MPISFYFPDSSVTAFLAVAAIGLFVLSLLCSTRSVRVGLFHRAFGGATIAVVFVATSAGAHGAESIAYARLYGHTKAIYGVEFSPDGMRIASASLDKTIRFWDASSGEKISTLQGHRVSVTSLSFNPDGARIISGGGDYGRLGELRLWEANSGEELWTLTGLEGKMTGVTFSPDGSRIAGCSNDPKSIIENSKPGVIKLWDAKSGEELMTLRGHTGMVQSVSFSPDGSRIASASDDKTIKLWDAFSGEELRTLTGHTGPVFSVDFSPDGTRIISGGGEYARAGIIRCWNASSGQQLWALRGHSNRVKSVSFSPCGARIASVCVDKTIKLWDANRGNELMMFRGHGDYIRSVSFSPDCARIASASSDKTIMLWDISGDDDPRTHKGSTNNVSTTNASETRRLSGHTSWVNSVSFSPDGSLIASASSDKTIKLWDALSGKELKTLKGHSDEVKLVLFSADGARLYSQGNDKRVSWNRLIWNIESGEQIKNADWNPIKSVAHESPDGRWLIIPAGNSIQLVDLEFKVGPLEKAYRKGRSKPKPDWHQEQAVRAQQAKNWFAATFHAAWWLKLKPESRPAFDALHSAHGQLDDKVAVLLPSVVAESLTIPKTTTTSQ